MERDCSHPLGPDTQIYPGDPAVERTPHATFDADGYRVANVSFGTHSGTHVDAPAHTELDGRTLDSFSVESFAFDVRRVERDCTAREAIDLDALPDATAFAESADARSNSSVDSAADSSADSPVDMLVLDTGWADHWGNESYFDHPYLAPEAAEWCADHGLHVGIDAPSVDPTPTEDAYESEHDGLPAHHALLGNDRLVVENLTNLSGLPERFTLRAYPLPIPDADAAPVRAVAETE